jgi:hypothetical protein
MQATTVPRRARAASPIPSGDDSLRVRERYLRRRSQRRSLGDRGVIAIWVAVVALVSWLFVVGFTILGR